MISYNVNLTSKTFNSFVISLLPIFLDIKQNHKHSTNTLKIVYKFVYTLSPVILQVIELGHRLFFGFIYNLVIWLHGLER